MESFRNKDAYAEKRLAEFMDRCFYSKLTGKHGEKLLFYRKRDAESQLQGIDVELKVGDKTLLIDEKASFYYSNLMIPTFAFEIDSIQKGHDNPVEGWYVNNELRTEFYFLIWPNIKCERKDGKWIRKELDELSSTDFTIVEAMLIKKKALIEEVEKRGYSQQRLIEYAKVIRNQMKFQKENHSEILSPGIKIMYSGGLAEKPINAVIQKDILRTVANAVYLIAEDGYAQIKG